MAYMNSLITGMQLAFYVGLTLAVVNGITKRVTGKSMDAQISERLPSFGGGQ